MARALITGITGQDGRHLAEFLVDRGYEVYGLLRGQSNPKAVMVQEKVPEVELLGGDLQDLSSLIAALEQVQPDEVYNLGAISFVPLPFRQPELTADITGTGVLRMLEAIRVVGGSRDNPIRFYQASSSEMFGKVRETPQTETTPFHPRSPYGTAKVFGFYTTLNYRESYGLHASNGILFNHGGPRRGIEFVERKVSNAVARIKLGLQDSVTLGNLDSSRDWATRETTWKRCGEWSNRMNRAITSSRQARPIPSENCLTRPLGLSTLKTGNPTSTQTSDSYVPPRSTSWSETPARLARCCSGNLRSFPRPCEHDGRTRPAA